jgi:hypothetical protein
MQGFTADISSDPNPFDNNFNTTFFVTLTLKRDTTIKFFAVMTFIGTILVLSRNVFFLTIFLSHLASYTRHDRLHRLRPHLSRRSVLGIGRNKYWPAIRSTRNQSVSTGSPPDADDIR